MPIYEITCSECGFSGETIQLVASTPLTCPECGGVKVEKQMSPTSSLTGREGGPSMPGPGDTACCGSSPGHAGCAGPGSCCGKAH